MVKKPQTLPLLTGEAGLPPTLARRVQVLREVNGLTQARLAEQANVPEQLVVDLESGIELFLAPSIRQKLARVLKIRPSTLQAAEKQVNNERQGLSEGARQQYVEEILRHPDEEYPCPSCQAPLIVRLFQRRDLEENPLVEVKAHCSKCLYKL